MNNVSSLLYTVIIYPLILVIEFSFSLCSIIFHNPGISVIGVSIAVSLLCLPLYIVAEHWQQVERDTEKELEPGVQRIKKSFTGDEQYMILSTYYRQHHYHPIMALRSSFGLLIQIPFFIAAYIFLSKLPALKGAHFLFIRDMGAPDALFHIGSFPVNVLPIAMTVINIIAGAVYTKGFRLREKIQIYGMALVFLVLLYTSPSGLVLYWTMNNIFSLVKNVFYKFHRPLRAFWICSCACCTGSVVFLFFFTHLAKKYVAAAALFTVFVFVIPLIVRLFRKLCDTHLSPLSENRKTRTAVFILSCAVLFILSGITVPSSLIASSPIEFAGVNANASPLSFIGAASCQSFGFWFFWPLCIYFLFSASVQTLLAVFMCCIAVCSVVNTFAFSLSYGDISTALIFFNSGNLDVSKTVMLGNILVLAALSVCIILFAGIRKGKICTSVLSICVLSLASLSVSSVASISKNYSAYRKHVAEQGGFNADIQPIFRLSKTKPNVVLLMLDKCQGQYVPELMKEDPSLAQTFSGFVFYPNTVSFGGHTLMGSPALYGGYEYTPGEMNRRKTEPLVKKHNEALLVLPRIFSEKKGFEAVITDPSWANYAHFCDLSILDGYSIKGYQTIGRYEDAWAKEHPDAAAADRAADILNRNLVFFSLFREAPVVLRKVIYRGGTYWSSDMDAQHTKVIFDNYSVLDYLPRLTDFSSSAAGTYTCIVNELTHETLFFQAPDYVPAEKVTNFGTSKYAQSPDYHTEMAAFKCVAKWIEYLKQNGVYDNTKIVIVSDHGFHDKEDFFEKDDNLDEQMAGDLNHGRGHFHSILMFKDIGSSGSLRTDDSFMTNADVPSLLLKGIVSGPVNPFTGKDIPLDTVPLKKDGVVITTCDKHQPAYNGTDTFSIRDSEWWKVKDPIYKADSWSRARAPDQK